MGVESLFRRVKVIEDIIGASTRPKLEFYDDKFFTYGGEQVIPFTLRPYQKEDLIAFRGMSHPKMFLEYNRRAGKDSFCWPLAVNEALRVKGNYAYMLPDREQASKVIWRGAMIDKVTKVANRFIDMIPKQEIKSINGQEKIITLRNGSVIYLVGASRPNSLRGVNVTGIVYSEFAFYASYEVYQILQPVIAESKGWQIIITTPSDFGFSHKLFKRLSMSDQWYTRRETVETLVDEKGNRYITEEDVSQAAVDGNMSEWMVRREFYCEPALDTHTLYYAKELKDMEDDGRMRPTTINHKLPVHFSMDLGSDGTPIIGFQVAVSGAITVVFYLKPSDEVHTYGFYWGKIQEFSSKNTAVMGKLVLPHDSVKRQVNESSISSAYSDFRNMGADVVKLKRVGNKDSLINLSKHYIAKTTIDVSFTHLIEALSAYSRKYDDKTKTFSSTPCHDWSSHPSDCFQYLCQSVEEGHLSLTSSVPYNRLSKRSHARKINML